MHRKERRTFIRQGNYTFAFAKKKKNFFLSFLLFSLSHFHSRQETIRLQAGKKTFHILDTHLI